MNRQDQIFEYAFGEMSAQDAQVFEATLLNDIEAQKEINALKGLRSDFGLLSDIPEMQFSKERLRDAILDQGIQPKKQPGINWFQWLMAPTAVAAMVALTFVVTRSGTFEDRSSITTAMLSTDSSTSNPSTELLLPGTTHDIEKPAPTVGRKTPAPQATVAVAKSTSEPRRRIRRPIVRTSSQPLLVSTTVPSRPGGGAFDSTAVAEAGLSSVAFKASSGVPGGVVAGDISVEDRTIIVIDKEQESGVGAVVATEVSVSQDVVIGG